jgi:GTPase SAR1 family protein
MDVYKILVVGEPQVGKSSVITAFFNCEELNDVKSAQTIFTKNLGRNNGAMMDFVLKIINVKGTKMRVQLWDMAGSSDPHTVFSPLFIRNAIACIVVGSAENTATIDA